MKYITYLVMCLVMLFAAPVVWAGQADPTCTMPEYMPSVALEFSPVVAADCRDVLFRQSLQQTVIYKLTVPQSKAYKTETRIWAGNLLAGITGDINLKGAAVLTGKAEFSGWQSADNNKWKAYLKSMEDNPMAGRIV